MRVLFYKCKERDGVRHIMHMMWLKPRLVLDNTMFKNCVMFHCIGKCNVVLCYVHIVIYTGYTK